MEGSWLKQAAAISSMRLVSKSGFQKTKPAQCAEAKSNRKRAATAEFVSSMLALMPSDLTLSKVLPKVLLKVLLKS